MDEAVKAGRKEVLDALEAYFPRLLEEMAFESRCGEMRGPSFVDKLKKFVARERGTG